MLPCTDGTGAGEAGNVNEFEQPQSLPYGGILLIFPDREAGQGQAPGFICLVSFFSNIAN